MQVLNVGRRSRCCAHGCCLLFIVLHAGCCVVLQECVVLRAHEHMVKRAHVVFLRSRHCVAWQAGRMYLCLHFCAGPTQQGLPACDSWKVLQVARRRLGKVACTCGDIMPVHNGHSVKARGVAFTAFVVEQVPFLLLALSQAKEHQARGHAANQWCLPCHAMQSITIIA